MKTNLFEYGKISHEIVRSNIEPLTELYSFG